MSSLTTPVIEVRQSLPNYLNRCMDQSTVSGYCREWSRSLKQLQKQHNDARVIFRETLLVTQKLNRSYQVDQQTRKDINQLILRAFSKKRSESLVLKEKPLDPADARSDHVFSRFLNAVKESYDTRLGNPNQFALDFQCRLTSMKISFDTVRVLKNWSSNRGISPDFNAVPASDLRTIVDQLYILNELQFGSMAADIILSDAILTAETQAKAGQLSIRDLL